MLKSQSALICEHVRQVQMGKWDYLGAFDRIFVSSLPAQHKELSFVVNLYAESEDDLGKGEATIKCLRPSGPPLFEQTLPYDLKPTGGTWLGAARVHFEVHGLPLPETGRYRFALLVGGKEVASHPLTVLLQDPSAK